jgi:GNAT superfamily N-acetyltransferase
LGQIRTISTPAEFRRALEEIRGAYYHDLPGWHAPPAWLELERFDRDREPFWRQHDGQTFIYESEGRVLGRITAFVTRAAPQLGRFGVFDSADDPAIATALLQAAREWLAERGSTRMEGPFFFSMHEEVGLLTSGHESPPSVLMPYNPPYYAALLEQAGLRSIRRFVTYRYRISSDLDTVTSHKLSLPGINLRAFRLDRASEEIPPLLEVYNAAFAGNWGFTPLGRDEGRVLVANLIKLGHPELVRIAESEGRPVGFVMCMPDINRYLHSIRHYPEILKTPLLLWAVFRKKARDCRVITLAILKEFRGRGLSRVLMDSLASTAASIGYRNAELSYIDTENKPMHGLMSSYRFETAKEYHLFALDLP